MVKTYLSTLQAITQQLVTQDSSDRLKAPILSRRTATTSRFSTGE